MQANTPFQEQAINTIRFLSADAVQNANSGHSGMPMGTAAIAYTLFTRHLRFNPANPKWFDRRSVCALRRAWLHVALQPLVPDRLRSNDHGAIEAIPPVE
ncbi:MAG: hypothetical protein RBS09_04145 [Anaerolineaceae bacterium]|jgi:transketolase|nr:hypothetical protein [Anaerolineaceae bacterium]